MFERISEEGRGSVMVELIGLKRMSMGELRSLFEERKRLLIEVRDEIDRREAASGREGVDVDFCKYIGDGSESQD